MESLSQLTNQMTKEKHVTIATENKVAKDPSEETTEIICVLDRSTSIRTSGLTERTIEGFNSFLGEQKKLPGKAKLTLCLFDGGTSYGAIAGKTYEIIHDGIDINAVPELNKITFEPRGMTAMWDAIGATIDNVSVRHSKLKMEEKPDKVVILVMTDGQENSSKEYNQKTVQELIKKHKENDQWAFVFIGANIDVMATGHSMGVSNGNTRSYVANDIGVKSAFFSMSASVSKMRGMSMDSVSYTQDLENLVADTTTTENDKSTDNKS